jgi:hypothetical protein
MEGHFGGKSKENGAAWLAVFEKAALGVGHLEAVKHCVKDTRQPLRFVKLPNSCGLWPARCHRPSG